MRPRSLFAVGAVAALLLGAAPTVAPDSPICTPRQQAVTTGLALVEDRPVTQRLHELTFTSAAMGGREVAANVLLPRSYDPSGETRYPLLLLLHGHGGDHTDWADHGVEQLVGDRELIVVMPDGGYDGWYSDWYGIDVDGHTAAPAPAWESFHLEELLPWIDAHLPTAPDRGQRLIAGLSMGGFGAMSYAARHPDRFGVAGSFSGAVNPTLLEPLGPLGSAVAANLPDGQRPDLCIWGDPVTQNARWHDHDPTSLVGNLAHTVLYVSSGNGVPAGPYDDPASPNPGAAGTEAGVYQMNVSFDRALTDAGIAHTTDLYGAGTHTWPYWQRALVRFLDLAAPALDAPAPAPPAVAFDHATAEPAFAVWGFEVQVDRAVREFLELEGVAPDGLTVRGSGTAHLTTAGWYHPRGWYRVEVDGVAQLVRADGSGRLTLTVDLGPSNSFAPPNPALQVSAERQVRIAPADCRPLPAASSAPGRC